MIKKIITLCVLLLLMACHSYDYTEFKRSRPKSILVLPPVNESIDIKATNALYAQITKPLAEAGYYVLPVTLVSETFKQNGMTINDDIRQIALDKLYQVFGADAVLYLTIKEYGTSYRIVYSETKVTVLAKLVDARTGKLLWQGHANASSREDENKDKNDNSLLVALITQVMDTQNNQAYSYAGVAAQRLVGIYPSISVQLRQHGSFQKSFTGLLYGHRSPYYKP